MLVRDRVGVRDMAVVRVRVRDMAVVRVWVRVRDSDRVRDRDRVGFGGIGLE